MINKIFYLFQVLYKHSKTTLDKSYNHLFIYYCICLLIYSGYIVLRAKQIPETVADALHTKTRKCSVCSQGAHSVVRKSPVIQLKFTEHLIIMC